MLGAAKNEAGLTFALPRWCHLYRDITNWAWHGDRLLRVWPVSKFATAFNPAKLSLLSNAANHDVSTAHTFQLSHGRNAFGPVFFLAFRGAILPHCPKKTRNRALAPSALKCSLGLIH